MHMPAKLKIVEGDITRLDIDAIVNAANARLAPGGGVCGAIHRAAGPELAKACAEIGGCDTGDAAITPGFGLPSRHVIHAVGPVWGGGESGEDAALAGCYRNALKRARENAIRTIAFPAISTGIYGFPVPRAAHIAVSTVAAETQGEEIERVIFCCLGAESVAAHERALAGLAPGSRAR
jgi:O-acetyl-ADP-ribose deacetylase